MTEYTEETPASEQKWYALTGRVVDAKVEADGDIHLALQDADGKNAGTVSAEIPVGPKWCEIRQMVFGWMKQKFPFTVKSVHDLTIAEHVGTVTGKAFYDIAHAPADHSNRRHSPKDYAVWEIHPVIAGTGPGRYRRRFSQLPATLGIGRTPDYTDSPDWAIHERRSDVSRIKVGTRQ